MGNDSPAVVLFDISGTNLSNNQLVISTNNTTTLPLVANASFVGVSDNISAYMCADVTVAGSPSNASGTLYLEYSPDNVWWDVSIQLNLTGPSIIPIPLRNIMPYFRVRYINGSIDQTTFRLTTIYRRSAAKMLTRFLGQTIDPNEPIEVTRSIMNAQYPDGSYNYVKTNTLGMLQIDSSLPQIQTQYDTGSSTINYIGTALSGTATSAAAWTIKKITFDSSGNPASVLWSNNTAIWDNRGIESYS